MRKISIRSFFERPDIQALPIPFANARKWNVPRIHSDHLTVQQFQAAVELSAQVNKTVKVKVELLKLNITYISQEDKDTKHAKINS